MRYLDSVLGDKPRLDEWLRRLFEEADSIAVRTGFLSVPGVERVERDIKQFLDRGGHLLIVAGGAPDQADPDALVKLGALLEPYPHAALRVVVHPEEFQNAKTYYARFGDGHAEALVGSPNLTLGGMETNHESAVVFDSREPSEQVVVDAVLRGVEEFRHRPGTTEVSEETRLLLSGRQTILARRRARHAVSPMQPTYQWDELLQGALDVVDATATTRALDGVLTGFVELDHVTGGLPCGSLTVIASRPGVGSSTLLLDIMRRSAIKHGLRTVLFCLDRPFEDVVQQILCAEAKIKRSDMRNGLMTEDDWTRLAQCLSTIKNAPLLINSTPGPNLAAFCDHVTELHRTEQLYLAGIDPITLIDPNLGSDVSRERELSVIVRRLKLLALELDIAVIVTAELGRGVEARTDKRPTIGDLRDSDTIAQVADNVLLIHRPDSYDPDHPRGGEADLILAKHRRGATDTFLVAHQLHLGRFVDLARS
ncbi:DnaB-like helicase C-terminal domain-containing protein [Nocardia colli]|uniref:DnaB-like helicase C-terminal domain-containing protein n=1 Tax=Nocardia colli TaxID=2545717 RepID=UPI0035D596A7